MAEEEQVVAGDEPEGVMPEHPRAQTESELLVLRQTLQNARMALANMKVQYVIDKAVPGVLDHSQGSKNHPEQIKPEIAKQERAVLVLEEEINRLKDGREDGVTIHISPIDVPVGATVVG